MNETNSSLRMRFYILVRFMAYLPFLASCINNSAGDKEAISTDTAAIASGQVLFEKNCSSCHNFNQDGIGPNLGGITGKAPVDWLYRMIKNPANMISIKDERALALQKRFKTIMPSFSSWTDNELRDVVAYLNTHKSFDSSTTAEDDKRIQDPIREKIKLSSLEVNLEPVCQFPASNEDGKMPLTRITKLAIEPGSGNLFVNDLRGKLYKLENGKPVMYLEVKKFFPSFIDAPGLATGFGSFAFHPDFVKNHIFYTTHAEAQGSGKADFRYADSIKVAMQWVLTEWKVDNPMIHEFVGTKRELMRINMVSGAHGVQEIIFNPIAKKGSDDYGLLYIGVGDGASVQEGYSFIPHSKKSVWGTILRIDPFGNNSNNGKYGIPKSNPFIGDPDPNTIKEIYAYGFRNPHRITWTRKGQMLVSNIGQANIEAIDLIKPGNDYGWPVREGHFLFNPKGNLNNVYPLPGNDSINKITYPVVEFDHDEGNAIAGGYEYWGKSIPKLKGKFLFGDIPSGRLFYFNTAEIKQGSFSLVREWRITVNNIQQTLKQVCGCDRVDLHFGRDSQGELYILTKADGKLYKIVSAKE